MMVYELDDIEKRALMDMAIDRARADLNDGQPLTEMSRKGDAAEIEDPETRIECDVCDAVEFLMGEVSERTLEDAGWYLGDVSILCPEHAEE